MSHGALVINATPATLGQHLSEFAAAYERDGVVILPGFFKGDPIFQNLVDDIGFMTQEIARMGSVKVSGSLSPEDQITRIAEKRRDLIGKVYDMGSRPNKLLSGMRLKLHDSLVEMARSSFPSNAVIASPSLSDTLHIFPPGQANHRWNLPVHQDYPYLLQSPNQITFWIGLSKNHHDIGGVTVWRGSHKGGTRLQRRNETNQIECVVSDDELSRFEEIRIESEVGDLVVFHSNIMHRSEKNYTDDKTRIVQLFRFSDLRDAEALRIEWKSADVITGGPSFEGLYPEFTVQKSEAAE